jgi:transposase
MKSLRIYLPEELEREFRKVSMESYGCSRGSLSKAAVEAIRRWVQAQEALAQVEIPSEPVRALRGLLRHVQKTSVELQHEAAEIRASRARGE